MPCGMWDLPGPGTEPVSPALAGRFLTTGPPGKCLYTHLIYQLWCQLCSEARLVTQRKREAILAGGGWEAAGATGPCNTQLLLWHFYVVSLDSVLCFFPLVWWLPGFGFGFIVQIVFNLSIWEITGHITCINQALNHRWAILAGGVIVLLFW